MEIITHLLIAGWDALVEYLSGHVLTCLVPAFFIAGAIREFISQPSILKYFRADSNKWLAFSVASVSGTVLAVCSCTVLPMFAGLYMGGAGIGPATVFLYAGPAINILAVTYSARLLGLDIGIGRVLGAVAFSMVIGFLMASFYKKKTEETVTPALEMAPSEDTKSGQQLLAFFAVLVGILVFGAGKNWTVTIGLVIALVGMLFLWFDRNEIEAWLSSTWHLTRLIAPWLLIGVFAAGILRALLPQNLVSQWLGGNSVESNLVASLFGSVMYFATLTEVPIVKAFAELGMGKGPSLALLLAGPALSLPSMLAIRSVLGVQKTVTYIALVVIMATVSGLIFGGIVA
ncbi:permease [candidate division KSB1 bacterium]|nr:permease [candidate division KSB1 bacterium]NIR71536.1 permease [candidate division KSB1 bacterium]NIS26332.1 permease [candidate division KSB1 bacterium]NIT73099.1 permease [candidate division KSB1 bacterium]NIU27015.1 permease [candidate division KSB1 bacterium]